MNMLELKNVTKKYPGFTLSDINLTLPKGSIMGFVGENGAGKTTTLKAILNLIRLDGGKISLFGKDHIAEERQIKQEIGVVFDECVFHDFLKSGQIGRMLKSAYRNWDDDLYRHYLEKFKLPADKTVKEFSKGMKMKLNIAAALAHRPKLLILDEPTAGLDPVVRDELLDIFLEFIQDEAHAILLSSHITSDLEKVADYITFIHEGKIVFSQEKHPILENYGIIKCTEEAYAAMDKTHVVGCRKNAFSYEVLVNNRKALEKGDHTYLFDNTTLDQIILLTIKGVR